MDPLITLFDEEPGSHNLLTSPLSGLYGGPLGFPQTDSRHGKPYVFCNFVTSLDGVVSYAIPGRDSGSEVSGNSPGDRFVMGLLRSVAGAVIQGTGTLRAGGGQPLTPEAICPEAADRYAELRRSLGLVPLPLAVILAGSGRVDISSPAFHQRGMEKLILTTGEGLARAVDTVGDLPEIRVIALEGDGAIQPDSILQLLANRGVRRCLLEGGPTALGLFLGARRVDELFLTLSPRIAGRDRASYRPGLVEQKAFFPDDSPQGRIISARRHGDHLMLRYRFGD